MCLVQLHYYSFYVLLIICYISPYPFFSPIIRHNVIYHYVYTALSIFIHSQRCLSLRSLTSARRIYPLHLVTISHLQNIRFAKLNSIRSVMVAFELIRLNKISTQQLKRLRVDCNSGLVKSGVWSTPVRLILNVATVQSPAQRVCRRPSSLRCYL